MLAGLRPSSPLGRKPQGDYEIIVKEDGGSRCRVFRRNSEGDMRKPAEGSGAEDEANDT
jgi:hypothetical protein